MAKITLENGITIEGTAVELAEMVAQMTAETDVVESEEVVFEKGDKVRLLSGGGEYPLTGLKDGDVYEVGNPEYKHDKGIRVKLIPIGENIGGGISQGFATQDQLEKVSDEEAASAKAQAEVNAVFTDAGRKPNEYREGDIVRYIVNSSKKGVILEVESDSVGDKTRIDFSPHKFGICTEPYGNLEPVVFVENRLDRN